MHIPRIAEIHIQNTAPGPPIAIAPATPAIFPVPTVPARAVQTAWKGVMEPSEASFLLKILPSVVFSADHRRDTPDEVINGIVDGFDCLKHDSNPFLDNV